MTRCACQGSLPGWTDGRVRHDPEGCVSFPPVPAMPERCIHCLWPHPGMALGSGRRPQEARGDEPRGIRG
jgi:hypothetical protein